MFNTFVSELLYVPYNSDFEVREDIKKRLTTKEFFENCCVVPSFLTVKNDETKGQKDNTVGTVNYIQDVCRLKQWLEGSGNGVFTIRGDAGTGKSTLLHFFQYSKYSNQKSNLEWEIVDIQKATEFVEFLGQRIEVPKFVTLQGKVVAALIYNVLIHLFATLRPKTAEIDSVVKSVKEVFYGYDQSNVAFPEKELREAFNYSILWEKVVKKNKEPAMEDLEEYAEYLACCIVSMINSLSDDHLLISILNLYRTILAAKYPNKRFVIAFDNLERFIGNDEIHNEQIDQFTCQIRHCFDVFYQRDLGSSFGIRAMMFVRNTTTRMLHPPEHLADHPGHDLDMSEWISIAEIVDRKRQWYKKHQIETYHVRCIDKILGSNCFDKSSSDNLQSRLESLFNRNNRILVEVLVRAINATDVSVLNKFDKLSSGTTEYKRFAARSIINRIVLDELSRDGFFKNISTQNDNKVSMRLGYARKILTVLHHYQIDGHGGYMSFVDFLKRFELGKGGEIESYFDVNSQNRRMTIATILFHMNYYNVRRRDWLQLIDMQYKSEEKVVQVSDPEQMNELIEKNYDRIGLRITNAGETYLKHIIQSFEFFSCRLSGNRTKPLVCTVPTKEELAQKTIDELECIQIINRVSADMNACIEIMKVKSDVDILYRKKREAAPMSHAKRIEESYKNFLNRFKNYIKQEYDESESLLDTEKNKYEMLMAKLDDAKQYVKG